MQFIICERGRSFSALESEQWCCTFTVTTAGYDSTPVIHGTFDVHSNSLTYHKYLSTALVNTVVYYIHSETCMGCVQGNRFLLGYSIGVYTC